MILDGHINWTLWFLLPDIDCLVICERMYFVHWLQCEDTEAKPQTLIAGLSEGSMYKCSTFILLYLASVMQADNKAAP